MVKEVKLVVNINDMPIRGLPGTYARVYGVTSDIAVKCYLREDLGCPYPSVEGNLMWEYKIGTHLLENGVQVPEMYGIRQLELPGIDKMVWCLFMQRIDPVRFRNLNHDLQSDWIRQYEEQIKLATDLGYDVIDTNSPAKNTLFDPSVPRLYLIDFVRWRNPNITLDADNHQNH